MQRRSVLIEVCAAELRAAVVARGRITASRAAPHWSTQWKETWPESLNALAPRLRALLVELGAVGLPATIFYLAPRGAAGVYSCPASAGSRGAEAAARLALADAAESSPDDNPTVIARLAADRPGAAGTDGPQIHTLAATDPEASVRAVVELGQACSLEVEGVVPTDAVALAATVASAINASRRSPIAVVVRIGSWGCTLAAAVDGRLRFVRQISVGSAALVSALAGGLRTADGATITLDRDRAAALLAASGIPARGATLGPEAGLTAEAVLPRLQPVLQRCIVEVRQSLRFGLTESERSGARLIVAGPGSRLPNLPALFATQLGLPLEEAESVVGAPPLSGGSIEDYAAGTLRGMELLMPRDQVTERRLATVRRGMWIGVAAACALAAIDGVTAWFELGAARAQQERLTATLSDSSKVAGLGRTLGETEAALRAARQRLAGWMTPAVRWDAMLAVLARQTPAAITLSRVEMRFEGRRPQCAVRGRAADGSGSEATAAIRSYMDSLGASPIVEKCTLGSARRVTDGQAATQEFEILITLVGLPADLGVATATTEDRP